VCWLLTGTLVALACVSDEAEQAADPCAGVNVLSDAERAEGWTLLFDGKSLAGWHGYNGGALESWTIEDCAMKSVGTEGNYGSDMRVDLVTDREYTNFELRLDWKVTEGGNSGIMYGVIEDPKYDAAWKTGPEYQLVDDAGFPEGLEEWQKAAANYAMHSAAANKPLNPVGEWNTSRLVVHDNHVEHWLNGAKVVEFTRWNDEWEKLKNAGKWQDAPDYGSAATGHIVIQDHGSVFWFRNVKLRQDPQAVRR
jgi:hypothetical protein